MIPLVGIKVLTYGKRTMHELSIALSIIDIVEEEADRLGTVRIRAIHLRLGPLSGVATAALLGAYEMVRAESRFTDVRLVIEEIPVVLFCAPCNAERAAESLQSMRCVECGAPSSHIVRGRELDITALEIEE